MRGPFSQQKRDKYTSGDCAKLALAVKSKTGWLVLCAQYDGDGYVGWHAVAQMPDGRLVDADGAHANWSTTRFGTPDRVSSSRTSALDPLPAVWLMTTTDWNHPEVLSDADVLITSIPS